MLFIVVLMFCICWIPIKTFQLLNEFNLLEYCTVMQFKAYLFAYNLFYWLAIANSFVNPIIYSFMSQSFRVRHQ